MWWYEYLLIVFCSDGVLRLTLETYPMQSMHYRVRKHALRASAAPVMGENLFPVMRIHT